MTFLQPEILYGLPLLLVPILIHLLNRRRYRVEEWGAMQFLIQATRASTSRAKLRQIIILAMRTLAVAMLVFFLARPLAGGWAGRIGGGKPETVFLVLDRSASMEFRDSPSAPSIREIAMEKLAGAWTAYSEESELVFVDSVNGELIPVDSIESVMDEGRWWSRATETTTSFPLLFNQIHDWILTNGTGVSEIWIASDLQSSNWQLEDKVWDEIRNRFETLPQKVSVKILGMRHGPADNISLSLTRGIDPTFGKRESIDLRMQFVRDEPETLDLPVTVTMADAVSTTQVQLEGRTTLSQQSLRIDGEPTQPWVRLSIPDDRNITDNNYYLVLPAEVSPRVEIYADSERTAKIIEVALQVGVPGESEILVRSSMDEAPLSGTAMVVWQKPLPGESNRQFLTDFVERGGTILFLPHDSEPQGSPETSPSIFETSWGAIEEPDDEGGVFEIANWDQQDGPASRTSEGFSLPLDRTSFFRRRQLTSAGSPMVLFSDNQPFLTVTRSGQGRAYWMTSLPSREWSALGQGYAFVPMVQRMLLEASLRFLAPVQLEAGRLPRSERERDWKPVNPATPGNTPEYHAGIYEAEGKYIAVNTPSEELERTAYTLEEISAALESLEVVTMDGLGGQTLAEASAGTGELQSELWKAFLLAMLIFLGAESFLTLPPSITPSRSGADEGRAS